MSRWRAAAAVATAVVFAGLLALGPATGASAHDYLVSSSPAAGSTVSTAVSKVRLTFDDRVLVIGGDASSNVVEVTGPSGKHFEAGCPTVADVDVTLPVKLGTSGNYTITWQIVSADGHTVSNSIAFTYDRPTGIAAAKGAAARPTCGGSSGSSGSAGASGTSGSAASSHTGSSAATGQAATSTVSSNTLALALTIGGGIIVLAVVAVVIILRRSTSRAGPPRE